MLLIWETKYPFVSHMFILWKYILMCILKESLKRIQLALVSFIFALLLKSKIFVTCMYMSFEKENAIYMYI